jgi:hypothetical protein
MVLGLVIPFAVAVVVVFVTIFILSRRWAKSPPTMNAALEVGRAEVHSVSLAFTQRTNRFIVDVDGRQIVDRNFATGLKLSRSIEFEIGGTERHVVRIQKTRNRWNPYWHPQIFSVFIDGVPFDEFESHPFPTLQ